MYGELPWRKNLHGSLKLSLIWGRRRWRRNKMKRIGFEVWEVCRFWFQTQNGGIYRVGKLGHELGCERTRLPLKFGQKTHNWSPRRWCGRWSSGAWAFSSVFSFSASRTVTKTTITSFRNTGIVIRKNRWKEHSRGFPKIGSTKPGSIWGGRYGPRNIGVLHELLPFQSK